MAKPAARIPHARGDLFPLAFRIEDARFGTCVGRPLAGHAVRRSRCSTGHAASRGAEALPRDAGGSAGRVGRRPSRLAACPRQHAGGWQPDLDRSERRARGARRRQNQHQPHANAGRRTCEHGPRLRHRGRCRGDADRRSRRGIAGGTYPLDRGARRQRFASFSVSRSRKRSTRLSSLLRGRISRCARSQWSATATAESAYICRMHRCGSRPSQCASKVII